MSLDRVLFWSRIAAPALGVAFAALWINAEIGRDLIAERAVGYVLIGSVIGIAPFLPRVALAGVAVLPVLQLTSVLARPESTDWPMHLGFAVALGVVAVHHERRLRLTAAVAVVVAATAASLAMALPHGRSPFPWNRQGSDTGWSSWTGGGMWSGADLVLALGLMMLVLLACGWAAGAAVRYNLVERQTRSVLATTERELAVSETDRRLAAQREEIAADVHDVLAHSLTVVLAQVDGAIASGAEHPVLQRVSGIARESLIDVRALIERLDGGAQHDEATPGLDDLEPLLARFISAGMTVTLREHGGRPALAESLQLVVLRIVQESLTNALKHGGRAAVVGIDLDWRGEQLALRVRSRPLPGGADAVAAPVGAGHGIGSMRDRARMAGGWLTAEPDEDAFLVTALLPLRRTAEPVLR
jgi:signal transduction histidine kinase